jgi:uncharacterized protein (TIGR02453 family)
MATKAKTVTDGGGTAGHFTPGLFEFLGDLKTHNSREWFQANKGRYETFVQRPMLGFIADFDVRLRAISGQFNADPRPVGGSMFRIHRDTRFAKDKSPYKTNVGAHFAHRAGVKGANVTGFYLHIEPGGCFGGGGVWHPDAASLKKVRDRIVGRPADWEVVRRAGIEIGGDTLKRAPAGYDPEHRFVEDLKRKDLYGMTQFTEREVCAPDFADAYARACAKVAPLVEFLTRAMGLAW